MKDTRFEMETLPRSILQPIESFLLPAERLQLELEGPEIAVSKMVFSPGNTIGKSEFPKTLRAKPTVRFDGQDLWAELAIVRLFQKNGWKAFWIDCFHRRIRASMETGWLLSKLGFSELLPPDHFATLKKTFERRNTVSRDLGYLGFH